MQKLYTLMVLAGRCSCPPLPLRHRPRMNCSPATSPKVRANFDAEHGKKNWTKEGKGEGGEKMNCTTCHGDDLSKAGKHHKTGKIIEPMAPSANAERFTDAKKIEKWFKRNCNDAWGRECTAQEKGDVLKFLLSK